MVKEKTEHATDWNTLWMKQSQVFFDTANANLKRFLEQGATFKPEENRELINHWLENFKNQWDKLPLTEEQKIYANYWMKMAKIFNDASNKMMEQWVQASKTGKPVKNVKELYDLWISCCQDAYTKSLHGQSYQEAYTEFMNQAFKFWKNYTPGH